jgi:CheY-like chemotaxis protein
LRSAKGAFVPRNKVRNSRGLDVRVLREFLETRKGRGCAPPDSEEIPQRLGGALDTAAVLREFLEKKRPQPHPEMTGNEGKKILKFADDAPISQLTTPGGPWMAAATFQFNLDEETDLPCAAAPAEKLQECVLLIEDSDDAMFLVQYALEEYGDGRYRLEWANTLNDGASQLSKGGVDLILLDLGLPDSSGPESYAFVRDVASKTPVVVLTGDEREETESAVAASGAQGYLVKDKVSGSLLLRTIRAALQAHKDSQERLDSEAKRFRLRLRIER